MTKSKILITLFFFFLAGLFEIGGGYLVWVWLRESMSWIVEALGGFCFVFVYILPIFQLSYFHRIYAAYRGIFYFVTYNRGELLLIKKDLIDMR
jgi:small multidrug resistance family-3 protein